MARTASPNDVPTDCYPIVPNDRADLPTPIVGLAFAEAGSLHVDTEDGIERTIPAGVLAPGEVHRLRIRRVYREGTTVAEPWGFVTVPRGVFR